MSGTRKPERPGRLAFALVCAALPACGSFDPVSVPHFEYLHVEDNPELGITGAHWIAYDDQHSLTSACTNGYFDPGIERFEKRVLKLRIQGSEALVHHASCVNLKRNNLLDGFFAILVHDLFVSLFLVG